MIYAHTHNAFIFILILSTVFLLNISNVSAQTTPNSAEIETLLNRIAELRKQIELILQTRAQVQGVSQENRAVQSELTFSRTLKFGTRGDDVTSLQKFLIKEALLDSDSATGFFGRMTERAVQRWQSMQGIVSSGTPDSTGFGVVGKRTQALLVQKNNSGSSSTSASNASGSSGSPGSSTLNTSGSTESTQTQTPVLGSSQTVTVPPQSTATTPPSSNTSTSNTSTNVPRLSEPIITAGPRACYVGSRENTNATPNTAQNGPSVDIKTLGVKGDGVTDDTTAIQNALDTVPLGTVLVFPEGTYLIREALKISRSIAIKGMENGVSRMPIIKYKNGTTLTLSHPLIWIKPAGATVSNVSISNVVLDGNVVNTIPRTLTDEWNPGIEIKSDASFGVENVWIENITIKAVRGDGITIRSSSPYTVRPTNIYVNKNVIESWKNNRQGIAIVSGKNIRITNNLIQNYSKSNYGYAFDIEPNGNSGENVDDVLFEGNTIWDVPNGIALQSGGLSRLSNVLVTRNRVHTSNVPFVDLSNGGTSVVGNFYGSDSAWGGGKISHGQTVTAYDKPRAGAYGQASVCAVQQRTCTDGTLSGTYQYASCQLPSCSITASASKVPVGEVFSLYLNASVDAQSAMLFVSDGTSRQLGLRGTTTAKQLTPGNYTYTFAVNGYNGTSTCSAMVQVGETIQTSNSTPLPSTQTCSISSTDQTVAIGRPFTVSWESPGAISATISRFGVTMATAIKGSATYTRTVAGTYPISITATGNNGTGSCQTIVTVQ